MFSKKFNVLILGSSGMLGHDLMERFSLLSQFKESAFNQVVGFDRERNMGISEFLSKSIHFDFIINCIGYTDTVKCEKFDTRRESYIANVLIPAHIASLSKKYGSKLIHISTNEVFSKLEGHLYKPTDNPCPVSVYGMEKYLSELMVEREFNHDTSKYAIIRTSWLFGRHRRKSFVHKVIRNFMKCSNDGIRPYGISDEVSIPTSTDSLVESIERLIQNWKKPGILHICGGGKTVSRFEWMKIILDYCHKHDYFGKITDIDKIRAAEIPNLRIIGPVVLDCDESGYLCCHNWEYDLKEMLDNEIDDIINEIAKEENKVEDKD